MKKLFLFDMDGTLTPPRKKINHNMIANLTALQRDFWEIGIISGSDMDYIEQQCDKLFDLSPANPRLIHFLPCNGTKYYLNFKKVWEHDMRSKLGSDFMTSVYRALLRFQGNIAATYLDIPLTGNFFQMRGSVLNWCPIGRNATAKDRKIWQKIDEKWEIRKIYIDQFYADFSPDEITIKLGGETSFDIYPKGWNKTFPLSKDPFTDYQKIYFAGDRCTINGNDKEIYDLLKGKDNCEAFQVDNPKTTGEIIKKILKKGKI
jgi:phosphomannomutase